MKIICEKSILLDAIISASWAVSAKSSIPTMEGLLLEANDRLKITGYNLETGIQTLVDADISEPGKIVINAKLLSDIIRLFPDEPVTISVSDLYVTITCKSAKYELIGLSADEFPNLPEIESEYSLTICQNTLQSMISQTIFAISTNDSKPIHTGSLFEIENNILNVVSIDGFRLAMRTEQIKNTSVKDQFSFVVPGHTLKEVEKLCDDTEEEAEIMLGRKHITFSINSTTIISRILDGEFLNYKNAIPKTSSFTTTVNSKELISSIERVSILINERIKNPIKCKFDETSIKISCITPLGKSQDECRLLSAGDNLEIGFNNRYLIDALKSCPDSEILIELNTHLSPIVIKPIEGNHYLYLILPVRLKAEAE